MSVWACANARSLARSRTLLHLPASILLLIKKALILLCQCFIEGILKTTSSKSKPSNNSNNKNIVNSSSSNNGSLWKSRKKVKRLSNEDKMAAAAKCEKKLYIAASGSNAMCKNVNSNGN